MRKRLVILLLSVAMTISSFPLTVFAEENFEEIQLEEVESVMETFSENESVLAEEQQEETVIEENIIEEIAAVYTVENEVEEDEAVVEEEIPMASTSTVPTEQEAYQRMIAMKAQYPEGTTWTSANGYAWKGGIYSQGGGCVGFAFLLSDAAFGDLPARKITEFTFDDVRVGDILRLYSDTHTVIVLEKHTDYVIIAEGNYAGTVHWGRQFTKRGVELCRYMLTRYPEETVETPVEEPEAEPLPAAVITSQPSSMVSSIGQSVAFTVNAENASAYQWYYSKDGSSWNTSSATGATSNTLTVKLTSTNQNHVYRCKITGMDGETKNSSKAGAVIITGQPKTCTAAVGTTASYTVSANNIAKYQWQYSKNNGANWYSSTATGADTDTISFKATTGNRTMLYRCKLTTTNGISAYSEVAGFGEGLTINTQPVDVTAAIGTEVIFTFSASNAVSYQWQYSKDGAKWYNSTAEGNTTNTLQIKATTTTKSNIYRCKVVGTDGSVQYTNSVTVR